MVARIIPKITALQAEAAASLFLFNHLPDRFCAGQPQINETASLWRVPVLVSYPFIGPVGEVGEITISAFEEKVLAHKPLDEMEARGLQIYEQRRADIEAAFSQTRDA